MKSIVIFTDGACSGNPGPGGWGAVLLSPEGRVRELGGASPRSTNNRMELEAVIRALRAARKIPLPVRVYTDSTYVILGITSWISGWKRKGWKSSEGKDVLNRDLWEELEALVSASFPGVSWHYVRGHSGSPGNERCDEIAVSFAQGKPEPLYAGPLSGCGHDLLRLPEEVPLPRGRVKPPKGKGGFYLSYMDGRLERHPTWSECQARVSGKSRALFKKVSSPEEEAETLRRWGVPG